MPFCAFSHLPTFNQRALAFEDKTTRQSFDALFFELSHESEDDLRILSYLATIKKKQQSNTEL